MLCILLRGFCAVVTYASGVTTTGPEFGPVVWFTPEVISGPAPQAVGLDILSKAGIRTIISVDGAIPDANAIASHRMRCIHIPLGYDRITTQAGLTLIRAVRDLPAPVYIHCHRGIYRGPAAAGYALVGLDRMTPSQAMKLMRRCGGSEKVYPGLFSAMGEAQHILSADIDEFMPLFSNGVSARPVVQAMGRAQEALGRLEILSAGGWAAPRRHPDLSGIQESRRLIGLVDALQTQPSAGGGSWPQLVEAYRREVHALSVELERPSLNVDLLNRRLASVQASCISCHQHHR
jgi:hypothetical protein